MGQDTQWHILASQKIKRRKMERTTKEKQYIMIAASIRHQLRISKSRFVTSKQVVRDNRMEEDSLAMTSTELQRQSDLEELKPNDNNKASVDMIHALSTGSIYAKQKLINIKNVLKLSSIAMRKRHIEYLNRIRERTQTRSSLPKWWLLERDVIAQEQKTGTLLHSEISHESKNTKTLTFNHSNGNAELKKKWYIHESKTLLHGLHLTNHSNVTLWTSSDSAANSIYSYYNEKKANAKSMVVKRKTMTNKLHAKKNAIDDTLKYGMLAIRKQDTQWHILASQKIKRRKMERTTKEKQYIMIAASIRHQLRISKSRFVTSKQVVRTTRMEEDSLAMTSTELQRQSDLEELKPNDNNKASVDMIHALSTGSIYAKQKLINIKNVLKLSSIAMRKRHIEYLNRIRERTQTRSGLPKWWLLERDVIAQEQKTGTLLHSEISHE